MAAVSRGRSSKGLLDDTIPLVCTIEGIAKKDHVDYIMKVQRGINPDDSWQVVHRYSDFVTLQSTLEVSGLDLLLPPKKVFGNMDSAFIAERQQGLQNYINFILAHLILARHVSVKRFLDPINYSQNFQENAMQNVAMFLRSVPNWEIVEPLPDIGWRLRKSYFLIKPTDPGKKDVRNILTWTDFGPDFSLEEKDIEAILKLLTSLQHPYLCPPWFTSCTKDGAIAVRNFLPNGTLRDCICRARPKLSQLRKYGNPRSRALLQEPSAQLFGRQILEALKFLHEKGLPYGHLHTGNIFMEGNVCRLLDIENGLMGVPSIHRHRYIPLKKIQDKEAEDVYCFAHVLYEMTFGEALRSSIIEDVPPNCPSQLRSILLSILSDEACNKTGLPSLADLLANPFFSTVNLPSFDKPQLKIPSKLREAIKAAKDRAEQRLKEDQKFLRQFRRASKAHAHHMSEEEKKKRKKSAKKLQKSESLSSEQALTSDAGDGPPSSPPPSSKSTKSTVPSSAAPPRAPGAPPPPPQTPAVPPPPASSERASPPPDTPGRGALLNSISGFKKGGLKKVDTNDRSKPKLG